MKPACIPPVINDGCIDPTPDGVHCFSYTHCLNVRSGILYYNPDPHTNPCIYAYDDPADGCMTGTQAGQDAYKVLPRTGSQFEVLLPLLATMIGISIYLVLKRKVAE